MIRKKRIKTAKYNNVFFYIETNETSGGRRIVTHEFPFGETPSTEDLGRKAKSWTISGFVFGALYKENAKELQDALDKPGVGTLDHPYLGRDKKVRCLSYRISESNKEYGFVRFSMTFGEAGEILVTTSNAGKPDKSLIEKIATAFDKDIRNAAGALTDLSDKIDAYTEQLEDRIAPLIALRESLGKISSSLITLKDVASSAVSEPVALFRAFTNTLDAVLAAPLSSIEVALSLTNSTAPLVGEIQSDSHSSTSKREMKSFVAESLVAVTIAKLSELPLKKVGQNDQKTGVLIGLFIENCDLFLERSQNNTLFSLVHDLRSQTFIRFNQSVDAPTTKLIQTRVDTNSLLLAYELYGDVNRENDLSALNLFSDPGFISRDSKVEVA